MGGLNPETAKLLKEVALDPAEMLLAVFLLLGLPMIVGMWAGHRFPGFVERAHKPVKIFSIGVFGNRWLLLGVGAAILLQIGAVHTSLGHRFLGTVGLSGLDWLRIALVSGSIWVADEILKRFGTYGQPQKRHEP